MGMNMKTNVSINDEFEDNMVDYVEESDDPMLKDLDEDEYFNGASEIQGVFWRIRTVPVCKLLIPLSQQFCRAQNIFFPVYDTCGLKQMIVDKVLISHRPNRPW